MTIHDPWQLQTRRWFYLLAITLTLVFFIGAHIGLRYPLLYPDTFEYLYLREHAHEGVQAWQHAFFARPILTGLYLALVQHDLGAVIGQALISFLAWLYLAWSVAALIRHRLWSRGVFLLFLAGALGRHTLYFNVAPVSESLSLSAACLTLGALLRWAAGRGGIVAVALAALLLVVSRDVWIYWLLVVASALLVLPALRARGGSWKVALVLYAVAALGMWSAAEGQRHVIPLKHAITHYVIDDASAREFFAQRGFAMPPAQQLQCHRQNYRGCQFDAVQETWLREHGKGTYQSWLLRTLPQRVWGFAQALPDALSQDLIFYVWSQRNPVYDALSRVLPLGHVHSFYLLGLAAAALLLWLWQRLLSATVVAPQPLPLQLGLAVTAAGAATLFVAYWGDGIEVARHLLLPALLVAVGIWLMLCAQLDAVIEHIAAQRAPDAGAAA